MNGAELWVKRRILGLSSSEAGDVLDLNPRTITRWEQKRDHIPHDIADHVDELIDDHLALVKSIRERWFGDDDGTERISLVLLNRDADLPDWVPAGTTTAEWNHAVATVFGDTMDAADLDVEWHRFIEDSNE